MLVPGTQVDFYWHEEMGRTCNDLGCRRSEPVVGHISDLGGAQREYFDLKEGEPVLRENGVEPDAAPHLSEFEGQ